MIQNSAIADLLLQRELLQMEFDFDKNSFSRQSDLMSVAKKVASGICWFPVSLGHSHFNTLNQYVLELHRQEHLELEHAFEYGKPVEFFVVDVTGQVRSVKMAAQVSYVDDDVMVVSLPGQQSVAQLEANGRLGVQLSFDETSYRAMFDALNVVLNAKGNRLADLRDLLLGAMKPRMENGYPVRFPWLNQAQERAVNKVLAARDVAIVHGPPGTGKTTTMVEAIYETLRRETQVLVCAQSNMAVDWISEKLVDRGVNVLRIGNPTRVNDKMLSFTYERRFESHPKYDSLWSIRKTVRELYRKKKSSQDRSSIQDKIVKLKDTADAIEMEIRENLFSEARVVACTLVGANSKFIQGMKFSSLFIDEAAQSLDAACWIAIAKSDRVVFAGDHCQLPPTIKCVEAARRGLNRTLMQKVVDSKKEVVSLLNVQYRMNEAIMRFSSDWFYEGRLVAAEEVKNRGILDFDSPIEWKDTTDSEFSEEFVEQTSGRLNKEEGRLLMEVLEDYITKVGGQRILEEGIDFGIISPYKAQVYYLRSLVARSKFLKPYRKLITINSVDGFQGQERDVVVLSLVRSNEKGDIGFLSDLRRMNVAITRARMKLIILGHVATLARHDFYRKLYGMCGSAEE